MSNASGHPAPRRHPHDGNGTKEFPIELDVEGSEIMGSLTPPADEAALTLAHLTDFTCAICLDSPLSITDVASISGCTHTFCFDCIDKWADTENRCPCCKARFRTIDRVVALPPSPVEIDSPATSAAKTAGGRKGKRKRSSNSSSSPNSRSRRSASASSPANRRPNSRTVEDRNQPSMSGIVIDAAFVQNILSTLMNATGGDGAGAAAFGRGGTGQVTFGTAADGRPVIRVINPQAGGMVGVMEMYLSDGAQVATGGVGSATVSTSARMTVRVRSRAPTSNDSRRVAGSGGSSSSPPPPRVMRPVTTELLQQMMAGRSVASGSAAAAAAATAATSAAAASARPAAMAASTFASLFRRGDNAGATSSSPRGRRVAFSVGGSSTAGAAPATAQMTIRIISRPSNASRSTSHSPTARSSNRRASRGGSTDNEPIVID
jgi:hypothetical protein